MAEGQDAEFACAVFGAPKPDVLWSMNGQELQNAGRFSIDRQGKIVGNLTISVSAHALV